MTRTGYNEGCIGGFLQNLANPYIHIRKILHRLASLQCKPHLVSGREVDSVQAIGAWRAEGILKQVFGAAARPVPAPEIGLPALASVFRDVDAGSAVGRLGVEGEVE